MYFSDKIISEAVKLGGHVLSLNTYTLCEEVFDAEGRKVVVLIGLCF